MTRVFNRGKAELFGWLLAGAYLLWRLWLVFHRAFDTDELQHLHSAWSLTHGQLIYRDFFEHHAPLLPFLLTPLAAFNDPVHAVWAARLLMLAVFLLMLFLQARLAERVSGPGSGLVSVLLLCSFTTFAAKSLESRPDLPAACLLSAALLPALQPGPPARSFWIGLILGLGFFFSPKIVYGAVGCVIGMAWRRVREDGWRRLSGDILPLAAGMAVPGVLAAAWVACAGLAGPFYKMFWLFNVRFRATFPVWRFLSGSLMENPALYALAAAGFWLGRGNPVALCTAVALIIGLFRMPMPYPQYFLLLGPALCLFASFPVAELSRRLRTSLGLAAALALASPSFFAQRSDLRSSNEEQARNIRCVMERTGEKDRVFDVWSGDSMFRPHAYYFCYLPPEIQAMIPSPAMERGILQALGDPLCRALIWGEYFNELPAPILEFARRNYYYAGCGRLFLRNE